MRDSAPPTSSSSGTTSPGSSPSADARPSAALAFGRFVFRYRDYLAPAGLVALLVLTRPRHFPGRPEWDAVLDAIGVSIALCGQLVRMTVIGLAYIKRGGRNKTITADRLVCEGVFAHCRNPMYVGNLLLITGLLVVWNSPLAYLVVLSIALTAFLSIVRAEETFLRGRFGAEFDAYCARVNRFLPNLRGFGNTLSEFDFDWRRVIRKEYGTTFAWTSAAVILIGAKAIAWHGSGQAGAELTGLAVVWLLLLLAWGTTRWLKKSRRLESPD